MKNEAIAQFLGIGELIVFFVFIVAFLILSLVLNYHWTHYEISPKNVSKARLWYFSVSIVLMSLMLMAIFLIL